MDAKHAILLAIVGITSVRSTLAASTARPGPHCQYGDQTIGVNERFFKGMCESCVCELYGTSTGVSCEYMSCPPALCSDAVYSLSSCCPICQEEACVCCGCGHLLTGVYDGTVPGASCKVGDLTISAGQFQAVNASTTCHCSVKDGHWDEAVCHHGAPRVG